MLQSTKTRGRPGRIRVASTEDGQRRFFTVPRMGEPQEISEWVSVVVWSPEIVRVRWDGRDYSGGSEVWDGCEGKAGQAFLRPDKKKFQNTLAGEQAREIMRSGDGEWLRRFVDALANSGKHGARNVFVAYRAAVKRGEVTHGGPKETEEHETTKQVGVMPGITFARWLHEKCPIPNLRPNGDAPCNLERRNPNQERNRPIVTDCDGSEWPAWESGVWLLPDAPAWVPRIPASELVEITDAASAARQLGVDPKDREALAMCQQKIYDWYFHGCPKAWEPYGIPPEVGEILEGQASGIGGDE